jgi:PAS domain S-box-containing protein
MELLDGYLSSPSHKSFLLFETKSMGNSEIPKPSKREDKASEAQLTTKGGYHAALFRLSADLGAVIFEEEVYHCVVEGLHDTLGYDFVAVFRYDPKTGYRHLVASAGFAEPVTPLAPGEGLSERPLLDGKLHYTPDVSKDPVYFYGADGSEVDVPIWGKDEVIGILTCERKEVNAFNEQDFEVLTSAAQIAGIAIEKARLIAQVQKRAAEFEALSTTMTEITSENELPVLLNKIVERATGLLKSSGGELALYDEKRQVLRLVVSHNIEGDHLGALQKVGEGLMGKVAETHEPIVVENYSTWHGRLPGYQEIRSSIGVPLLVGNHLVGVFTVASKEVMEFDEDASYLLNLFSQQAAIAIQNASLLDQAQQEIQSRIKIQYEIIRQKEYFEALLVNNPVAVVTADLSGSIISWNPSAEKLFGYATAEAVGRDLDSLVAKDPSLLEEASRYTQEVIEKGHVQTSTVRTRRDGSFVEVELLALPVIVAGETIGFIVIYHDLTEIKSIENQLRNQNQKMARELELAGEIQASYLPRQIPEVPGWQLHSFLKSSRETSGDFYDIHILPDGRLVILIADVVDKGVGAALFMSLCWTLIRTFSVEYPSDPDLVMERINQRILEDTKSGQFMSLFFGVLEPSSGEFVYANAGHPPPYFFTSRLDKPILSLNRTGMLLGVSEHEKWKKEMVSISPGDGLLLYTDGVTEGINEQGMLYGGNRLKNVVGSFSSASVETICSTVLLDLENFAGAEAQSDDIAMVVVKRENTSSLK